MAEETKRCTEEEAAVNEAAANAEETTAEERQNSFGEMITLALETALKLD